jgi:NADH-quinone oxidoreductase subunit F
MKILTNPALCVGADLEAHLAAGPGGLRAALADPGAIIATIERAGLRGLGGAGFPTHRKWSAVAAEPGPGKWVICNGNEDEPGTFKDAFLLAQTPHQVIEGALVAALATRAPNVALYVNPRDKVMLATLGEAVTAWGAHALLAQVSAAIGEAVNLHIVESSGLYIGGEETAAVASVAGGFPFPTLKPPYPAQSGVHGKPTLVNNVETLAQAGHILGRGAATGTKLFSLSGDVLRPGLHELPFGTTLRALVMKHGGGMLGGRRFKAVFTGGPSNTLLTEADFDVAMDFDSLRERGSRLGTGAMIVVGEGTSILRKTAEYVGFFAESSCGQCPPCKIGTFQIARLLARIESGHGHAGDIDALRNLAALLPGSGRCGLVDGAATVLASSLKTFPDEYARAIR